MQYHFVVKRQDYVDYAGGRVLYGLPGQPAFPVRLASEIWQRCWAHRAHDEPCLVYDPCGGGAYQLAVLGFLHGQQIAEIVVSDVNTAVLTLAQRNLSLLAPTGLARRIVDLQNLYDTYQKPSHAAALASAERLWKQLPQRSILTKVFAADAMDEGALKAGLNGRVPDIVFSDIPYGWLTRWQSDDEAKSPVWQLLESLRSVTAADTVVAIAADKRQKVAHEGYERLQKFQIGKRQVWIGRPL